MIVEANHSWPLGEKVLQLCSTRNTETDMDHDDCSVEGSAKLSFDAGTVCIEGLRSTLPQLPEYVRNDDRTGTLRIQAIDYAPFCLLYTSPSPRD